MATRVFADEELARSTPDRRTIDDNAWGCVRSSRRGERGSGLVRSRIRLSYVLDGFHPSGNETWGGDVELVTRGDRS